MRMQRRAMLTRLLIVLLALGLLFGGIFGWKAYQAGERARLAAMPPPPATVTAAVVRKEQWIPYLDTVGSLTAIQGIDVTSEVAGQVSAIHFHSGQPVKRGELLLQLDDSVDQADLAGLLAEQNLAEQQFARAARLVQERSVSRADYDNARASLENARARVAAKQAAITKKTIRAPFAGQLGIRQVALGQYLPPGAAIVPLQMLQPIYLDASLPERHLAEIAVGQPVEVRVQAYPGQHFSGALSAINPGIDPGTRSLQLRASLDNPDARLRPGMFAEVRLRLPQRQPVLTLPQTAISYNPYGASVFVIHPQDERLVVESRQIETGEVRDGRVVIVAGLHEGEQVVNSGQVKLRNGMSVSIDNRISPDGRSAAVPQEQGE